MKKAFLILILIFSINSVFADSPLTTTEFYTAYLDIAIVNRASKSDGVLKNDFFNYLNSKSNSIDKKIALINALKWDIKGKNNADLYFKRLLLVHKDYTYQNFYRKGTAEELICYAYLKAMDNYFDVKKAAFFSSLSAKQNPNSYTIAIINQLIKSQMVKQNNWCQIYSGLNIIRENKNLIIDFRKEASNIIFAYTDGYKEYCSK